MLLELSKIKNLPVGSFDEGALIGKINRIIIDYKGRKAIGFVVKPSGMFSGQKIISIEDVIDIDRGGVVVRSVDSLVDIGEVVRIAEIVKSGFELIGLKAISKEGINLGRVYDALIDSQTGNIVRIYVRQLFSDYVFDNSQIEAITPKLVKLNTGKRQRTKKSVEALSQMEANKSAM